MRFFIKLLFVLGIAYIFIGYGTDKFLQTFTGITYLSVDDTIENDVVSIKTGITVVEYDDHILVKQASSFSKFTGFFRIVDDLLLDGLLQNFLSSFLEMDITLEVRTFDVIILLIVVSFPALVWIIVSVVLKMIVRKLELSISWSFVANSLTLIVLFLAIYQPIIGNLANIRMMVTYNEEASMATMEILQSAIDKKRQEEKEEQANSLLSAIFPSSEKQKELVINLGDQLKTVNSGPNNSSPPNLVDVYQSDQYQNADEKVKEKLNKKQIKQNANELRKLIFWVYAGVDMGEGRSNTEFSTYSQELVELYFNSKKSKSP